MTQHIMMFLEYASKFKSWSTTVVTLHALVKNDNFYDDPKEIRMVNVGGCYLKVRI